MENKNSSLTSYFPKLTTAQLSQFQKLEELFLDWNAKINLISRKDEQHFYERHVLHSLSIGYYIDFLPETRIMDVGTGGGFPGIPLAILFPEVDFFLIDSIGKKIKVVEDLIAALNLKNISTQQIRAEEVNNSYDFIVTRAVAQLDELLKWTSKKINKESRNEIKNGILALKGGDLTEEIKRANRSVISWDLSDSFSEDFFETKKLIYVSI